MLGSIAPGLLGRTQESWPDQEKGEDSSGSVTSLGTGISMWSELIGTGVVSVWALVTHHNIYITPSWITSKVNIKDSYDTIIFEKVYFVSC